MAIGDGVCVHIVYEHRAISCTGFRRQIEAKPYGDRAEIVGKSCSHRAVSAASARKSYRAPAASVRRQRGDCVVFGIRVPKLYKFTFLLVLSVGMTPKTMCGPGGGRGGGAMERGPRRKC